MDQPRTATPTTWDALAAALGTNPRQMHRLRKRDGAPAAIDLAA